MSSPSVFTGLCWVAVGGGEPPETGLVELPPAPPVPPASSAIAPLVPERREKPQRDVTIFCCQIKPFSDGECCRGRRNSKLHFEWGFAGVCNKSRVTAVLYGLCRICSLLCRQPSQLQGLTLTSDTKELFTLGSTLFIL